MAGKKLSRKRVRRLKRRKSKRIKRVSKETLPEHANGDPNKYWSEFVNRRYNLESERGGERAAMTLVRDKHIELFGNSGKEVHHEIRHLRVGLELLRRGHEEEDCEDQLPPDFHRNYEAAMEGRVDKLSPSYRALIVPLINASEIRKEKRMAKRVKKVKGKKPKGKKSKKSKKEKGPSAQGYAKDLLLKNDKAKLSDKQLQKKVLAKFPDSKAYQRTRTIERLRKKINAGEVKSIGKPAKKLVKYPDKGKKKKGKKK